MRFGFLEEAEDFAERNNSLRATQIGPKLGVLINASMAAWDSRFLIYERHLSNLHKIRDDALHSLKMRQSKIRELRGKLRALNEAQGDR